MSSHHMPPPNPEGALFIEGQSPYIEVFFRPSDERLQAAGINPDDDEQSRVKILEINGLKNSITIFPTNMFADKPEFLGPKYDQVRRLTIADTDIYDTQLDGSMPTSRDDILETLAELPSAFTKNPDFGLGLAKDYRFIINSVEQLSECSEIVISPNEETRANEMTKEFFISYKDFERLRRSLNNITSLGQSASRAVKTSTSYNLLADRIGKSQIEVKTGRHPVRKLITAKAAGKDVLSEHQQEAVISILTSNAQILAQERPEMLAKLQNEIELVTFDVLIAEFEMMLNKRLAENRWQSFFNENPLILNMAFGYPIIKVRDQASVGGKKLSGAELR